MNPQKDQTMLEYVLEKLHEYSGRWPEVARQTNVPYNTLTKLAYKRIQDPRIKKIELLARYFRAMEEKEKAAKQELPFYVKEKLREMKDEDPEVREAYIKEHTPYHMTLSDQQ